MNDHSIFWVPYGTDLLFVFLGFGHILFSHKPGNFWLMDKVFEKL